MEEDFPNKSQKNMSTLERLLDIYVSTLLRETERYAKIKLLSVSLELINGGRKAAKTFFFSLIWSVVFTAATFSIVLYEIMEYARTGTILVDGFLLFASVVWILSFGVATWFLREKRWINAFEIQRRLDILLTPRNAKAEETPAQEILNEETVTRILDEILEEKFTKFAVKLNSINQREQTGLQSKAHGAENYS